MRLKTHLTYLVGLRISLYLVRYIVKVYNSLRFVTAAVTRLFVKNIYFYFDFKTSIFLLFLSVILSHSRYIPFLHGGEEKCESIDSDVCQHRNAFLPPFSSLQHFRASSLPETYNYYEDRKIRIV